MNLLALLLFAALPAEGSSPESLAFRLASGAPVAFEMQAPSLYCAVGNDERNAKFTVKEREIPANVCGRNLENLSGQVFADRSIGFALFRGEVYRQRVKFFDKYGWSMKLGNADPRDNRCPMETVGLIQVRGDYAFGDDRGVEGYCLFSSEK